MGENGAHSPDGGRSPHEAGLSGTASPVLARQNRTVPGLAILSSPKQGVGIKRQATTPLQTHLIRMRVWPETLFSCLQEHDGRSGVYRTGLPFSEEVPGNGRYEVPLFLLWRGRGAVNSSYVTTALRGCTPSPEASTGVTRHGSPGLLQGKAVWGKTRPRPRLRRLV